MFRSMYDRVARLVGQLVKQIYPAMAGLPRPGTRGLLGRGTPEPGGLTDQRQRALALRPKSTQRRHVRRGEASISNTFGKRTLSSQ